MTEETYTKFNNDLLEAIARAKFNGTQCSILLTIVRYTAGFHRDEHKLSVGYISEAIGAHPTQVRKELKKLIDLNVVKVLKETDNKSPRIIAINKSISDWMVGVNLLPLNNDSESELTSTVRVNPLLDSESELTSTVRVNSLPKKESIKENIEKESVKENIYSSFEQWYGIYPRKQAKQQALKAWIKLSKEKGFSADLIINNTLNYAETCKELDQDTKFIPYPATYLNQKRYEDYEVINPEGINPNSSSKGMSLHEKNMQLLREIGGDMFDEDRGREEVILDYQQLLPEFPD